MVVVTGGVVGVGSSLPSGRREQRKPSALSLGLSLLSLARHNRFKLSREGPHDPQIPKNLGLGDLVFSERKEIEVWTSAETLVS